MIDYNIDEKKLINNYYLLRTSLHFYNFLYRDEFDRENAKILDNIPKEHYNKIIVTQCALMISLYKDKYLVKNNLNINETGLNLLLEPIIGLDNTLEEKMDALNNLRHKLLHGDYYISKDLVILNNNGVETSIKIDDLCDSCSFMFVTNETLKTELNERTIISIKTDIIKKYGRINSLDDLRKVSRNIDVLEFTDEPEKGYERTDDYACVLESFYLELSDQIFGNKTIYNRVGLIKNKYNKKFKENHINLSFKLKKADNLETFNIIKKVYLDNKDYFDKLSVIEQYETLSRLVYTHAVDDKTALFFGALVNNVELLNTYRKRDDADISGINYQRVSIYYIDDMTIAAALGAFYGIYHYGLESILSKNLNLKQILNNETLDFSKLDMTIANDPKMDKTVSKKRFESEYEGLKNKIIIAEKSLDASKNKYTNYKEKARKKSINTEIKLLKEIREKANELKKTKKLLEQAEEFLNDKCDSFSLNYNIISHLRNAIAHGNVYIHAHEAGDTLNDRIIEFDDIHEGRSTYKLKIKYIDFIKLLEKRNVSVIMNYLNTLMVPINKKEKLEKKNNTKVLIKKMFIK
jgi:hypothetical protein